ncbi:MAG: flagellar assembly protein T N-terminal domain-containing protein, partial [Candidatus Bathyarchaeia archaeon]
MAREKALEDALRRAVEQAVGTFISSDAMVENGVLLSEKIYKESKGFVKSYEVVEETVDEKSQLVWVTIKAEVLMLKLSESPAPRKQGVEIDAVAHRIVHGGERLVQSTIIDEEVKAEILRCVELAPLHNPPNLIGIDSAMKLLPQIPHVGVFDTAFFVTMPPHVYTYAIPREWAQSYRIRRFGFHGTSHLYVSRRTAVHLGRPPSKVNLITLHIGNGVSITAVKQGLAFDHSMGFTPLEGAVMGTRCGDIDPAIPLYLMEKLDLSPEEMLDVLNRRSGLLGITRRYSDRRDILKGIDSGDEDCKLAFELE